MYAAGTLRDPLLQCEPDGDIVPKAVHTEFRYIIAVVEEQVGVRGYGSRINQGYAYRVDGETAAGTGDQSPDTSKELHDPGLS